MVSRFGFGNTGPQAFLRGFEQRLHTRVNFPHGKRPCIVARPAIYGRSHIDGYYVSFAQNILIGRDAMNHPFV